MTRERQIEREAAQRQAAIGSRARAIQEGKVGPVLKRWINSDIAPQAALLRTVAAAYLGGDMSSVAALLCQPTQELSQRERPLAPLMEWVLRGSSPGRKGTEEDGETTYADDLCLAFMATLVTRLASAECSVSAGMGLAADTLRDTVQGQFIVSIQGAKAMQKLRETRPELWKQKKSLARIAAQLASQVKPKLERPGEEIETRGSRKVFKVVDYKGDLRRLELARVPDAVDWQVMTLCWDHERTAATSQYRNLWLAFAGMLLSIAQQTGGWFEVTAEKRKGKRKGSTRMLVLSEAAQEAIARDVSRWVQSGFHAEPMIVPPEKGDYLTVKHKRVTGQRPPKGLMTNAEGSLAWEAACILAETPWTVNPYALPAPDGELEASPEDTFRVAEHRRLGVDPFYLPTSLDFRGRIYYRPQWVGPQSGDLGKSLLCFPDENVWMGEEQAKGWYRSLVMHMAGLFGGPSKVDKAPFSKRFAWYQFTGPDEWHMADKPLTLGAHWNLQEREQTDRIPVQLDGTCNGLQHLSALFRDEEAARHVNLCESSLEDAPADIYGVVAHLVQDRLEIHPDQELWQTRMEDAGVSVNRSLCKGPVMVLPYGGSREAVRMAIRDNVLSQLDCGDSLETPWHRHVGDNYEAFRDRPLPEHPLFNNDIGQLASLVWESIAPVIPRAMAAMKSLQEIAGWVGSRGLQWRTGPADKPLWVTQAKSKAVRKQVTMRGFHLPDMVRRLTLMAHSNEVDPRAHRTGIVANFIHSLDAAHLARAIVTFRARGGGCVGAVHDCLLVRPSEAGLMGTVLRETFVEMYREDPLSQPVRLIETEGPEEGIITEYDSWYALADAAGVVLPSRGAFNIEEVKQSAWFFS